MIAPPELLGPLAAFRGQRVLLGVSGGADSVGLLLALLEAGVEVAAGHLDHALRPGSAGDAAWVAALCERLGVPLYSERTEVGRVAAERGWNLEDAARRLRYSFLSRAAKAAGAGALLTAHTRRDQAETVLWQLLRGEASLPGIPARRGRVWRPWLGAERESIEGYLRVSGQDWRDDESNLDPRYTRNWLRHEVMPALSARFPGLEGSLARLAAFQAEEDDALSDLAARLTDHAPRAGLPLAVLRRFVRLELRRQGVRDVRAGQLAAAAGALREGRTLHLDLPGATPLTVTGGRVLSGPPTVSWPLPDFLLPPGWALRHRKDGDRLRRPGGSRKLSDVLTDAHVPRAERDELWLLAREADVQWLGLSPPVWAVGAREAAGQLPDPLHAAMGEALELARAAAERGEVPVGALVLCG
ncbi:MAG: tRNA lysidine(34) synthetase TilS, partial [Deinococcus sp.]